MTNNDLDDLSKEFSGEDNDRELCIFIIKLLEYCGTCVQRGYMKPFVVRNRTIPEAREIIRSHKDANQIMNSYKEFKDNFNSDILFKE